MKSPRGRPAISKYCLIRDSVRLHELIALKMKQRGMNYTDVANSIGVVPSNVRKYILFRDHTISQQKVLAIASNLGISVSLNIEVNE